MKAAACAEIELGLKPGAEHQTALWLGQGLGGRALEARRQAVVAGGEDLLAKADHRSEPAGPIGRGLGVGAEIVEPHAVGVAGAAHRGDSRGVVGGRRIGRRRRQDLSRRERSFDHAIVEHHVPHGVLALDEYAVVPLLQAEDGGRAHSPEREVHCQGRVAAQNRAGLVLPFLVPVHRIVQEMGEVVDQGLAAVDRIEIGDERPVLALRRVVA